GRHEQGAAFAALGYARASGKTGVCFATSGPGATNLVTVLADALLDSVPLVAITGQVPQSLIGTDAFQEVDVLGLSLACTKHSVMVRHVDELLPALYQAFELAASGRPGPVLVDIPKDIQLAALKYRAPLMAVEELPTLNPNELASAKQLLQSSLRPIVYAGGGVGMAGAVGALQQFLQQTGMPSVATLKGLGCIDARNPHYLGMLGMHGLTAANLAVQECDLLLVVGARFDDRVTGKLAQFAPLAKVIHLDIDPAECGKLRQPEFSFCGDLTLALNQLSCTLSIDAWLTRVTELSQQYQWDYNHPGELIYAPKLLRTLANQLPDNNVVSCDVGQHQMWVAQHMWFRRPEDHLSSAGLGTMGFGLPAAIGAQFARPKATVVAVCGDGSIMMNIQELATINRYQLGVKIVVIDNSKLGMVKQWQELFFNGRLSETDLSDNPDFVALAAVFNIAGRCISRADEVEQGLAQMLAHAGPFLLHVKIDSAFNVWPLVPPGAANHQMLDQSHAVKGEAL
ncbi:MAG: acetolactate synthase 2 catalytic subunit, partial [Shewanella sp.]